MHKLFATNPIMPESGLTFIRMILGFFLIYHGWEIFDANKIKDYTTWETFKSNPSPSLVVYIGKGSELVAGILLFIGMFTRITCIMIMGIFTYISFFVGHGKILYEDQHPFLFVLLALVFFFTGPGKWSVDNLLFPRTL